VTHVGDQVEARPLAMTHPAERECYPGAGAVR
jgi:hypothetical protein